jgi:hypothetical protein
LSVSKYTSVYFILGDECTLPTAITPLDFGDGSHVKNGLAQKPADAGTVVGIIIVIILGSIILFLVVYCKYYRKFKRLKTELAQVHYIADPNIQPGTKNH